MDFFHLTANDVVSLVTTAAGATLAAAGISRVIDGLKKLGVVALDGREKAAAFLATGVLVVFAGYVGLTTTPPAFVVNDVLSAVAFAAGLIVAGYGILKVAMGVHDDISHPERSSSIRNAKGWSKE